MSRVRRLLVGHRIFFVTVNLRPHQFWDRFVRHERELAERLEYIHHNPVRRGLVKRPEDWRWSSYSNFSLDRAKVEGCPIRIDFVRLPERYRG